MYNLLMTAASGAWNSPTWVISMDRFLEHTNKAVASKFASLTDDVVEELKRMPTLFTYEKYLGEAALVGRITEIQIFSPQPRPPKVFLSYSWDSPEHRQWVAWFGATLRQRGIDVILDQWHVRGGEDVAAFMERSIRESDRVLVICTDMYVEKALSRRGGVGFEHMIVTGELMQNVGTSKFIPIVRQSSEIKLPAELRSRFYFDLAEGPSQSSTIEALAKELHNVRTPVPPLGQNPYF